ncbi:hypothetical protein ACJJTC_008794 [Scirpophaga incertulas]
MATKMKRICLHLRTFFLVVWTFGRGGDGYSCPYGQRCAYEPAPPGRAPACALPGLTYCLYPDSYPEQVIRQLIQTGQYDARTLLSDESLEEFDANKKPEYPYGYGPNSLPHVDQISLVNEHAYPKDYNTKYHTRYNHDIFTHKTPLQPPSPVDPSPYNINAYHASNFSKFFGYQNGAGYWNPNLNGPQFDNGYDKKLYRQNVTPNFGDYSGGTGYHYDAPNWFRQATTGVTQYNPNEWWKYISPSRADVTVERALSLPPRTVGAAARRRRRNAALLRESAKRTLTGAEALRIALGLSSAETATERSRRQAAREVELCPTRVEYITPRAALNNRGSWRYVVNMPGNMTQLVRVEICTSSSMGCNGMCSVPNGYRSRCNQKYLQKRLVALGSTGDNLYTDVFWIPSCCQCTIEANIL